MCHGHLQLIPKPRAGLIRVWKQHRLSLAQAGAGKRPSAMSMAQDVSLHRVSFLGSKGESTLEQYSYLTVYRLSESQYICALSTQVATSCPLRYKIGI